MPSCELCNHLVVHQEPYCKGCGHPRITKSLLEEPRNEPPWVNDAYVIALLLVVFVFTLTFGVAFLREARALRWSRTAIETHDYDRATNLITPFVRANSTHTEGLYLAGQAAFGSGRIDDGKSHYHSLSSVGKGEAVEAKISHLRETYHQQLVQAAAKLPCGQGSFAEFHARYQDFWDETPEGLYPVAAAAARGCVENEQRGLANEPGFWLINTSKEDPEVVTREVYLKPAKEALAKRQYALARAFAMQSRALEPKSHEAIDTIFRDTRKEVSARVEGLKELCRSLRDSPEYRDARGRRCFPELPPEEVVGYRDSQGNITTYQPWLPGRNATCFRGFILGSASVSLRVDQLLGEPSSPLAAVVEFDSGRCSAKVDRFWLYEE